MSKILWQPNTEKASQSQMAAFINHINKKYGLQKADYQHLHQWSVENIEEFWAEIWNFCNVKYSKKYDLVVDRTDQMPGNKWFEGARLNFAENLLKRNDEHIAIVFRGEDIVEKEISYHNLYEEVRKLSAALRKIGVSQGDCIAAFMPNLPETIIAMLATASIGAIWSSTSPDFGIKGVLDRFSQIKPKVIFAADGYYYKGRIFDSQEKLKGILKQLPSVEKVIMTSYTNTLEISDMPIAVTWEDFAIPTNEKLSFEQLPFSHPLYIMYSSGTTGLPKSMVHSAGGTLLQHLKEHRLHCNLTANDSIFYYTTCGWMMWNWLVTALATGSTIVLFDGNPFYPTPEALLKMSDDLKINIFGTSAKYISSLEAAKVVPKNISDFKHLKVILSTGSPLTDESFEYVYRDWKKDVQLSSIAGGTDIVSCFVLGNPVLPVHKGEIQCKGLGMDVDCFTENGQSVLNEEGELVCKKTFPCMPVYFWDDVNGEKYHNAYFSVYENIWHHGDYITISPQGGVIMLGRSDATLNPGGVRIGTSEIYRIVEALDEIDDSVVVGKKTEDDEIVVLFVKMNEKFEFNEDLQKKLKTLIRSHCSPRHVPTHIFDVPDIPYTINGKKVEVAIKKIIHGKVVSNKEALANPDSLEFYERFFY